MSGIAYVFPGQGSQKVGMGQDLVASSPPARALFEEADSILGFSLSRLCFEGPMDELTDTANAQPAILVTSLAALAAVRAAGAPGPACVAGHSLGHFTALVAADALSFPSALKLVRARGLAMRAAGEQGHGGMAAILKLDRGRIREICRRATEEKGGYIDIANDNAPDQVVIAGSHTALEYAASLAKEAGARRVVPLAVSVAGHTPLMSAPAEEMRQVLANVEILTPRIPVISNVSAQPLNHAGEIAADIVEQLTSPVRWVDSVKHMAQMGCRRFVEIGPGEVLSGLIKRILPETEAWSVDIPEGMTRLISE